MKKLVLVFAAMFVTIVASAQYATETASMRVKGSTIYLDGNKLSQEEAATFLGSAGDEYLNNRKGYKVGLGLSVGGASLTAVSGFTFLVTSAVTAVVAPFSALGEKDIPAGIKTTLFVSAGGFVIGAAAMLAGIPTAAVYQSRIKKLSKEYNHPVTVTVGSQSSGIGVALKF